MKSHIDTILEISRQDQMGALSPWFQKQLEQSIQIGHYANEKMLIEDQKAIVKWLSDYREQTGVRVVVLGMSGGVDSAVCAALFKKAGWAVTGYALPIHQDPVETQRGVEACIALGIHHHVIDLSDTYDHFRSHIQEFDNDIHSDTVEHTKSVKIRRGNLRARLRMMTLYNMASMLGGVVASTDNLSELQAGFWTLHGDVGDISPIQSFNKGWEVPMLAKISGVPESTWRAKPTDGLGIDAGDEAQLGCSYLEWDLMFQAMSLAHLVVSTLPAKKDFIIEQMDFDGDERALQVFESVYSRAKGTWFKRMNPINFEHPRMMTLASLERTDRKMFQPAVVR